MSMDLNGNAITVSNEVWALMKPKLPMEGGKVRHPISAAALKPVVDRWKSEGKPFKMGMVFPVSTHNYELRYWLAAGGLNPGFYTTTDISGTRVPTCCSRSRRRRRCPRPWKPARSTVIAWANPGTSRRWSRASACR